MLVNSIECTRDHPANLILDFSANVCQELANRIYVEIKQIPVVNPSIVLQSISFFQNLLSNPLRKREEVLA